MENLNATGTLSLAIETSQADQSIDRLEARLTKLGMTGIGGVGSGSQEAAAKIRVLEAEVEALSKQLNKSAEAQEKLGRVTRSWSAADGASRVAFRENAQLTGEQVKNLARQAEELKAAEKATRELGRAKDQANRLELRVIAAEESAKLREAEKAAKELARAKDLANRFELKVIAAEEAAKAKEAEKAIKELARAKELANRLELKVIAAEEAAKTKEAEKAIKELARAKDQANRLELRVIAAEEAAKAKEAEKAIKELARAKDLANRLELRVIAAEEAAKVKEAEKAAKELARAKELANRLELKVIAAEEAAKAKEAEKAVKELARAKDQANRLELKVIAAEEAAKIKEAEKATRALLAAQKASAAYATASPQQQASMNLRAGVALERGYDTSGYAAEAVAAARAAGSVEALRSAKAALAPQTQNLTQAQRALSASMQELHTGARGLAGSFGALWMTYGNLVPLLAGAALGAAFKSTLQKGAEFEYQLTFVKALGGETAAAVQQLSNAAMDLGKNGLYGPIKVAEGMRILAQAGLSAKEQLAAIPQVLDLATVGELGVDAAAETLVGVATAFGKTKLQLQEVGDVISKAAAVSQTSVQGMTESMKYASVVGEQYQVSLEDTSTALAVLAKLNITGTSAGTAFRNMVKELYTPTAEASKAFKLLGIETRDSQGSLRNMVDIMYDLKGSLEQYDKASQTNILQKMFGERGAKEAIAMLAMTREEWNKLKNDITDSKGFMGQVAAELEATTKGTLSQAFNTLEASLIEVFNTSKYGMGEMASSLKELFGSEEFKQLVADFVKVTLSAAQALVDFNKVLVAIAEGYVIGKVALAVDAMVVALRGVGIAGAAASTGMLAASGAGARIAAALAPLAGPAGLVALVATGILALWTNSKSGDEAAQQFTGSLERMNNVLDRQYQKLLDSNTALRERIRLANGQPEVAQNTLQSQVKDAESEYSKRAKEFNAKIKDMQSRGLYTGPLNASLNSERNELAKQYEEIKKLRDKLDKSASATIDNALLNGRADQADRDAKRKEEIRKLAYDLRNSSKKGAKEMADQLEGAGVLFADIEGARNFLDKGKKTVNNDTWSKLGKSGGSNKANTQKLNADISNFETDTRSLMEAYKRAEVEFKGKASSFAMAYPDAIQESLAALEKTNVEAQKIFDKMDATAGGDDTARARAKAARQRFNDEYKKEQQSLNQQLLTEQSQFLANVERATIESGQRTLSTEELYQREWHSKFGDELKKALLMSASSSPELAAQGKQLADQLVSGFSAGLRGAEIEKALKTISAKVQAYQAEMSVLLKKDQDGGLFGAIFGGTAGEIYTLRDRVVQELSQSLALVEAEIQRWNASGDSDKRLQLIAEKAKLESQLEEVKQVVSPALKDFADTMGMGMANAITNGFQAGENPGRTFAKNVGDAIKKSITKALADSLSKEIMLKVNAVLGGGDSGGSSSGGLFSSLLRDQAGSFIKSGLSSLFTGSSLVAGGTALASMGGGTGLLTTIGAGTQLSGGLGTGLSLMGGGTGLTLGSAGATGLTMGGSAATAGTVGATSAGALGGAAGTLGTAMSALASAAPYIAAAVLVAQYLGAFKGPTYHKGGATIVDSTGKATQATNDNTANFNLGWGAYKSDRTQAYDDATKAISSGLVDQIKASIETYGGDAKAFSVTTRFASDNDDWSEGAIRILDESKKTIFEITKRYTKDSAKALQDFGADGTRALVGALQNANLDEHFKAIIDVVDPVSSSLEQLQAALNDANTMAVIMNSGADALKAASEATMTANSRFLAMGDSIREMASSGAYSMAQVSTALQERYNLELELIKSISAASKSINESFQDSIRNIQYSVLDDQGKYAMLDAEAARYMDMINSLTDVDLVEKYAGKLNDVINTAFSLVDPAVQKDKSQEFIDRLNEANDTVQKRLESLKQQAVDDQKSLAQDIADQMMKNFQIMQTGLEKAAAAIPEKTTVDVQLNLVGGPGSGTEVGYIPNYAG